MPRAIADDAHGEHYRDFNLHANDGSQRSARTGAEQRDGGSHCKLEEIAGTDECTRSGHRMLDLEEAHEPIRQRGVEVHLNRRLASAIGGAL